MVATERRGRGVALPPGSHRAETVGERFAASRGAGSPAPHEGVIGLPLTPGMSDVPRQPQTSEVARVVRPPAVTPAAATTPGAEGPGGRLLLRQDG